MGGATGTVLGIAPGGGGPGAGAMAEGAREGVDTEVGKEPAVMALSSIEENGACTTATDTGRGVFLATVGRKTTGAVEARLLMKPGANGRAVRFSTELEGSSGSGVGAGAVSMDTAGPVGIMFPTGATAISGASDMTLPWARMASPLATIERD